jgi:uncharacterized protein (TIGR02300 family)
MANAELGLKRTCVACGTRFYDLARAPAICPKCATEQPAEQPRAKRAAPLPEEKPKKRVAAVEGAEVEDADAEEVADDAVADDADDLEDEDDLDEAIPVEGADEEET